MNKCRPNGLRFGIFETIKHNLAFVGSELFSLIAWQNLCDLEPLLGTTKHKSFCVFDASRFSCKEVGGCYTYCKAILSLWCHFSFAFSRYWQLHETAEWDREIFCVILKWIYLNKFGFYLKNFFLEVLSSKFSFI